MAEYLEGQGIKTHRDDDVKIKIVDGQSGSAATDIMSIAQPGDAIVADTNDYGVPLLAKTDDGDYTLLLTDNSGALKVVLVPDDDDVPQHDYHVHSGVVKDGTDDNDVVVTSGKKVKTVKLMCSSPGLFKYDLGLFDGVSTFTIYHTVVTQPGCASFCCELDIPEVTGDGTVALRVRATNKDNQDNDAFSSISFVEYA